MSTLKRALGNSTIMLASQAITWSASLILTAALGWHLGDSGFGNLYLAISFGVIFSVLVEFGLNQQLVRAVARDRTLAGAYLVNSLAIKLLLSLVAYGAILILVQALHYGPDIRRTILFYCLILFCNGLATTLTAVYQATQHVVYGAVGTIIEKVFVCSVALALLARGYGVTAMAVVMVAGAAANALWQAALLRRVVTLQARPSRTIMIQLARGALPFFLYWVLGSIYYRVDTVLLSKLVDASVLGWYGAAYRLFDTLVFLPNIVSSAIMFPILARLSLQSRPALREALGKGLSIILIVGIPLCGGLFILADPIIRFIYRKPEFLPAVPALQWLAVALLLLYVNSMLAVTLVSLNEERKMTVIAGLATIVNLGLNWLLIPRYQHVAAAGVTAVTEGFILCYLLAVMPKDLWLRSTGLVLLKALGAAAAMGVALVGLHEQPLVLRVLVGGLVYCLAGLLLRLVPADDARLLLAAVRSRRSSGRPEPEAAQA